MNQKKQWPGSGGLFIGLFFFSYLLLYFICRPNGMSGKTMLIASLVCAFVAVFVDWISKTIKGAGRNVIEASQNNNAQSYQQAYYQNYQPMLVCPRCRSNLVSVQIVQENQGSVTNTKTKATYKRKGHGLLYWLFIGWWFWIIDLFLWIFCTIPRLIIEIIRPKKYKKKERSKSVTNNQIAYKKICTCQNCGNAWITNM